MPFSEEDWKKLKDLGLKSGLYLSEARKALDFFIALKPDDLAEWFQSVTSPLAASYLLSLWSRFLGYVREMESLWPELEKGSPQACKLYKSYWRAACQALNKMIREAELRMRPKLRVTLLGFGEITRVLDLEGSPLDLWCDSETGKPVRMVFKKMLPFPSREAAEYHAYWYLEYNRLLRDKVGVEVPPFDVRIAGKGPGPVTVYMLQGRIDPERVCVGRFLERLTSTSAAILYRMILKEYGKVYNFNKRHAREGIQIGIDGQIPNWAIREFKGSAETLTGNEGLIYLDTTVPMIRIEGRDVISPEIYLQTLPSFARRLIKALNLDKEVLNRYYNFRTIMLDFVSNFIVRHRPDLVPLLIELSNEALFSIFWQENWPPITWEEVQRYYKKDVFIWRFWRSLRLLGGKRVKYIALFTELYRIWTKPIF
ncbi:MAG: DUF6206 family protein [Anaerolineae bacterium]|nr:DUF6206 family protein [Anaerolineae bacterium]MDW8101730.1 DUF6206 family protein [Anaerolineae bacterium]